MPHNSKATQQRRGIISAGTWTVDYIKLVNVWPQEEHLADIIGTDKQGGGSGHNLAVDIRKLDSGLPVEAIGLLGNDDDAKFLQSNATQVGIDTRQLHTSEEAQTSFTDVISVVDTGKRTFFHYRGTSDLLSPLHFDFSKTSGRILHLGLIGVHATLDKAWQQDANGWVTILKAARAAGIKTNLELVSIDAATIRKIARPCIPWLDTLIVNEIELGALSGSIICHDDGIPDPQLCIKAATTLFDYSSTNNGTLGLIVVHSPQRAIAITANNQIHSRDSFKIKQSDIISSVGAGDAFCAGMLYGIHENWGVDASLELAHATAAASLRSATTVGSVESVEACLTYARQNG